MAEPEPNCSNPNWHIGQNLSTQELWDLLMAEEKQEGLLKAPTFLLLSILMVVGLAGNIMVLLVYWFRFPASTTKSFILGMASYDLLNCLAGMPFEMYDLRYDLTLDIPAVCKIMRFLVSLSACGSITILIVVSVDRFRRICQPFRKQMSVKQSKVIIGLMTLLSAIVSVPALILYGRQTEYKYGIALYECTIDDSYRGSAFSTAYQMCLGGMWIICIIILIAMYSFIIFKIQQQKKRREKLSSQSLGSAVLTRFKVSKDETNSKENGSSQNQLREKDKPLVRIFTCGNDNQTTDVKGQVQESNKFDNCTRNSSIKRLFSRDVNPIFEEKEEDLCNDGNFDSMDTNDIISLTEDSGRRRHISNKASVSSYCGMSEDLNDTTRMDNSTQRQSSLNNYLAASQDTNFSFKSGSSVRNFHDCLTVPQDAAFTSKSDVSRKLSSLNNYLANSQDTEFAFGQESFSRQQFSFDSYSVLSQDTAFTTKSETSQRQSSLNNYLAASQDTEFTLKSVNMNESQVGGHRVRHSSAQSRKRRIGQSMGRYRPFDSDELTRQSSTISSPLERDWASNSYPLLDDVALSKPNFLIRRASSLPDLARHANVRSLKFEDGIKRRRHSMKDGYCDYDVSKNEDRVRSENSLSSSQSESEEAPLCGNVRPNNMNVTWNSIDNVTFGSNGQKIKQQPGHLAVTDDSSNPPKSRSASTATTVTQLGKKKNITREIKTSKVSFMMLLVTVGFVLSYLPHLGIQLFRAFSSAQVKHLLCTNDAFFCIYHLLMRSFFFNNSINPIIYSFCNKTFRQRCLLVLKSPKTLFLRPGHAPGSAPSYSQDYDGSQG